MEAGIPVTLKDKDQMTHRNDRQRYWESQKQLNKLAKKLNLRDPNF